MSIVDEFNNRRRAYMHEREDQRAAHRVFYAWLVDVLGITDDYVPVSVERLRASSDPHFNDIPLATWDGRHNLVQTKARAVGFKSWSMSETVCVLKERARQMVERRPS